MDQTHREQSWISLLLRLSIICLFSMAAISKFIGGLDNTAIMMTSMFKDTFLPAWLVSPYAQSIAYLEIFAAIWLLVGIKLRAAWIYNALLLLSLGFGMLVAKQSAADIYLFFIICCAGLYFSRFDCFSFSKK